MGLAYHYPRQEITKAEFERADALSAAILKRTGLARQQLCCPREKSEMTPCVARDGAMALAESAAGPICVGCETRLTALEQNERKHT